MGFASAIFEAAVGVADMSVALFDESGAELATSGYARQPVTEWDHTGPGWSATVRFGPFFASTAVTASALVVDGTVGEPVDLDGVAVVPRGGEYQHTITVVTDG